MPVIRTFTLPRAEGEGWRGPTIQPGRGTFRAGRFARAEYRPASKTIVIYVRSKGRTLAVTLAYNTIRELAHGIGIANGAP